MHTLGGWVLLRRGVQASQCRKATSAAWRGEGAALKTVPCASLSGPEGPLPQTLAPPTQEAVQEAPFG